MEFINQRILTARTPDGGLPIMFTIRGETEIPVLELDHLEGYRGSKPVRIGNGTAFHQQFDMYGDLMDAIYLNNKYGKPMTWALGFQYEVCLVRSSMLVLDFRPDNLVLTTVNWSRLCFDRHEP